MLHGRACRRLPQTSHYHGKRQEKRVAFPGAEQQSCSHLAILESSPLPCPFTGRLSDPYVFPNMVPKHLPEPSHQRVASSCLPENPKSKVSQQKVAGWRLSTQHTEQVPGQAQSSPLAELTPCRRQSCSHQGQIRGRIMAHSEP